MFDLIEYQKNVRESYDPMVIYTIWDDVCWRYDTKKIGKHEFEEMKEAVFARLSKLAKLKKTFEATPVE